MSQQVTFITGNQNKAHYLSQHMGTQIAHRKADLDEIQSLDLHQIVEHKVRQAYQILKTPVLVEDISLEFTALGQLPGPFVKFFIQNSGLDALCRMLDGFDDRSAVGRCCYGYFDGQQVRFFDGELHGTITQTPAGSNGFGWDAIFVPQGYSVTRAELDDDQYAKVNEIIRPYDKIRKFLTRI